MSEVNSLLSGPVPGGGVGWVEENRIYLEADNLSHIFKDPVVKYQKQEQQVREGNTRVTYVQLNGHRRKTPSLVINCEFWGTTPESWGTTPECRLATCSPPSPPADCGLDPSLRLPTPTKVYTTLPSKYSNISEFLKIQHNARASSCFHIRTTQVFLEERSHCDLFSLLSVNPPVKLVHQ